MTQNSMEEMCPPTAQQQDAVTRAWIPDAFINPYHIHYRIMLKHKCCETNCSGQNPEGMNEAD